MVRLITIVLILLAISISQNVIKNRTKREKVSIPVVARVAGVAFVWPKPVISPVELESCVRFLLTRKKAKRNCMDYYDNFGNDPRSISCGPIKLPTTIASPTSTAPVKLSDPVMTITGVKKSGCSFPSITICTTTRTKGGKK